MRIVILLGMAATTIQTTQKQNIGPYIRDRARYNQLQTLLLNYKIITSNCADIQEIIITDKVFVDSSNHIDAHWSRLGAQSFTESYIKSFKNSSDSTFVPTIDYIIMDYFRMPPNYITLSIFEFFITLYEKSLINHETIIILPHQQRLIQHIKDQTNKSIQFSYELIDKTQNPLYTGYNKCRSRQIRKTY